MNTFGLLMKVLALASIWVGVMGIPRHLCASEVIDEDDVVVSLEKIVESKGKYKLYHQCVVQSRMAT